MLATPVSSVGMTWSAGASNFGGRARHAVPHIGKAHFEHRIGRYAVGLLVELSDDLSGVPDEAGTSALDRYYSSRHKLISTTPDTKVLSAPMMITIIPPPGVLLAVTLRPDQPTRT